MLGGEGEANPIPAFFGQWVPAMNGKAIAPSHPAGPCDVLPCNRASCSVASDKRVFLKIGGLVRPTSELGMALWESDTQKCNPFSVRPI